MASTKLMQNIVGYWLFFKSDPRGDSQTYHDCAEALRESKLIEWYKDAKQHLDLNWLTSMKNADANIAPQEEFEAPYFNYLIAELFRSESSVKIGLFEEFRDDIYKDTDITIISNINECKGLKIIREYNGLDVFITEYEGLVFRIIQAHIPEFEGTAELQLVIGKDYNLKDIREYFEEENNTVEHT